jgi:hypothetical protein
MRRAPMLAALLLAVSAPLARGDVINVSTGLDASNNVITTGGMIDAHWTVTVDPTFSSTGTTRTVFPNSADWGPTWAANDSNSDWIARRAGVADNGPAPYTFTRTFDLTGYNLATATLSGAWTIDDAGTLALNGNTLSTLGSGAWVALKSFSTPNADFVQGLNTLTITITSADRSLEGVRLSGSVTALAAVPEPSTLLTSGVGAGLFLACGAYRRFRSASSTKTGGSGE